MEPPFLVRSCNKHTLIFCTINITVKHVLSSAPKSKWRNNCLKFCKNYGAAPTSQVLIMLKCARAIWEMVTCGGRSAGSWKTEGLLGAKLPGSSRVQPPLLLCDSWGQAKQCRIARLWGLSVSDHSPCHLSLGGGSTTALQMQSSWPEQGARGSAGFSWVSLGPASSLPPTAKQQQDLRCGRWLRVAFGTQLAWHLSSWRIARENFLHKISDLQHALTALVILQQISA